MTGKDSPGKNVAGRPEGQQFRNVYIGRGDPTTDSRPFRVRLCEYVTSDRGLGYQRTKALLRLHVGLEFPTAEAAFREMPIGTLLSVVTLVAREFVRRVADARNSAPGVSADYYIRLHHDFIEFVRGALRDEHLAYEVDHRGGVHPLIDQEFQSSRSAAIASLEGSRYENVRTSLERAFDSFTVGNPDTRSAVDEVFHAAESLFKLIVAPASPNLTEATAKSVLQPLINQTYGTAHESTISAATRTCGSFAKWADACHPYRHGHGSEAPVPPPIELAVVLVSQGASFIRWLAGVDRARSTP
jgi:hypothetical protein